MPAQLLAFYLISTENKKRSNEDFEPNDLTTIYCVVYNFNL